MNALIGSLALWPLEQCINQLLRSDPHIQRQLAPFCGRCLAISTRGPEFTVSIQFSDQALHLSSLSPEALGIEADAWLRGETGALLQLLSLDAGARPLANPALQVSGDVQLLQELSMALQRLDLDWQDVVQDIAQPFLGDVLSHQLGRVRDHGRDFIHQTRSRLGRNLADYLHEEARWVVSSARRDDFDQQLLEVRLGLDRVAARLARAAANLGEVSD